jgi:hypothetical protein
MFIDEMVLVFLPVKSQVNRSFGTSVEVGVTVSAENLMSGKKVRSLIISSILSNGETSYSLSALVSYGAISATWYSSSSMRGRRYSHALSLYRSHRLGCLPGNTQSNFCLLIGFFDFFFQEDLRRYHEALVRRHMRLQRRSVTLLQSPEYLLIMLTFSFS